MTSARTMNARRHRIAALLGSLTIRSQEELRQVLADEGFTVTQSTLSRDLEELGAVKVSRADGEQAYAVPGAPSELPGDATSRVGRVLGDLLADAEASGNIVVLRTPPGGAQLLASALDRAGMAPILGTVAGDDTVLVVTRDPDGGRQVAEALVRMARGTGGGASALHGHGGR